MITNYNTNTNSLKVRENYGIRVDLVPREGWRNPTGIRLVLEAWACKVGELEIVKQGASFVDFLLAGLSWGPKPCLVAIVPHAPSDGDDEFYQLHIHALHE